MEFVMLGFYLGIGFSVATSLVYSVGILMYLIVGAVLGRKQ